MVLEDQDKNEFLNKRAEENKPYVKPLSNLRFKGIFLEEYMKIIKMNGMLLIFLNAKRY